MYSNINNLYVSHYMRKTKRYKNIKILKMFKQSKDKTPLKHNIIK